MTASVDLVCTSRAFNERSLRASRQPRAAAAGLLGLQRKMPSEGLAEPSHSDAVWRSDGAASQVSMHRLRSHRDGRRLAIALPIDT